MEMRLLFQYHHTKTVEEITQSDITDYLIFIKKVHGVGRAKCRSVAQSCAYFFKKIFKKEFVLPSNLYPRKEFILPKVMSQLEVKRLLDAPLECRERAMIDLLYGTGIRISEAQKLVFTDIDRAQNRIKIRLGKGGKDRFVLLPQQLLISLGVYYRAYRPKAYLFESKQYTGKAMHQRSLQTIVNSAMVKAGFVSGKYTAHSLRHSFATHLLDAGTDLPTIKELLGHSKIETTMIYLHLQQSKRNKLISPLDALLDSDGPAE